MADKKKESPMVKVSVRAVDANTDEVAIYRKADPYVNRVIYPKSGLFKEGEYALDTIEKKEEEAKAVDGSKLGQIEPAVG